MSSIATVIVNLLVQLMPLIGQMSGGAVSNIITMLENIIPIVVKEATDLLVPIQSIISDLRGSGVLTPDQLAATEALSAKVDAEFDAAAKAAGV